MPLPDPTRTLAAAALATAGVLTAGCAAVRPAELALPEGLQGLAAEPISGIGGGSSGRFALGATTGRFERSASSVSLFDLLRQDRVALQYTLDGDGTRGQCKLRGNTAAAGSVQAVTKPTGVDCDFTRADGGAAARLELRAVTSAGLSAGAGTRDERAGRVVAGPLAIGVRSLHRVAGSPLPLAAPAGYVFERDGRAVGAIELTGSTPRLWRPAEGPARDAVTQAALALALLWDPAAARP